MKTRREFLIGAGAICLSAPSLARALSDLAALATPQSVSALAGSPTDRSVILSLLSRSSGEAEVSCVLADSPASASPAARARVSLSPDNPSEVLLDGLRPDTRYRYRISDSGQPVSEGCFCTKRTANSAFDFTIQGDSHPERVGRMFDAGLYRTCLENVAADMPDFHIMMGDDFSIDRLVTRGVRDQSAVDEVYRRQRDYLTAMAHAAPVFHLNGNHEQAAAFLLDGTPNSFAAMAGRARNRHFPLPQPGRFYTGDEEAVPHVGLLRDYYAWEWGGALFVFIDPYWHSKVQLSGDLVEGQPRERELAPTSAGASALQGGRRGRKGPGKGGRNGGGKDLWQSTLGGTQYRWLTRTLLGSKAQWKFVFCHHVLGTGRGGIELARGYEWGGQGRRGDQTFAQQRPGWELPIHDLMIKAGVTIFFQGHDHLYARQDLDGIVYQTCPCPADPTFTAFNRAAYLTGDIHPNSGHLRVRVAPQNVAVEYVGVSASSDNRRIIHRYEVARKQGTGTA